MDSGVPLYDHESGQPGSHPAQNDEEDSEEGVLGFSDYNSSLASSGFTSLASYVLRHSHEDGRRYQSFRQGSYPLPNDNIEQEREEMKHMMVKRLLHGNDFCAPISNNPQRIIDIGTGVGLWAIDVADKFPSAEVVGIDMTPIQSSIVPLNVVWRIDDIENTEWSPPYSDVDFIHLRSVVGALSQPIRVIESAYRNLKPGGWIEFQDAGSAIGCDDDTVASDHPMRRFTHLLHEHFAPTHNWDPDLTQRLPPILQQTGFSNIQLKRHKIPIGSWPLSRNARELGLFLSQHVLWQFIQAILVKWPDMGLASRQEADALEEEIKKAFDDPDIHAYLPWISLWAQKPLTG